MVVTKAHSGALRRLKWLGPACLLLAAAGIALASHYWYNPRSLPVSWLDPQWGQVLFFGGIPLAIALFSLISPAPAGIIGLFLTLFTVRMYTMTPIPPTPLIPPFVYLPLCGIFVAGCSLQIILGIKAAREVSSITSETVGRIHMAARITTLLTFVCSVIVFFIYPAGAALGFIILGGMALGIA